MVIDWMFPVKGVTEETRDQPGGCAVGGEEDGGAGGGEESAVDEASWIATNKRK